MPTEYVIVDRFGDEITRYNSREKAESHIQNAGVGSHHLHITEEHYNTTEDSAEDNDDTIPPIMFSNIGGDDEDEADNAETNDETGFNFVDDLRDRFAGDDGEGNVVEVDDRGTSRWGLGSHSMDHDINFDREIEQAAGVNDDLAGLLRQAQGMVEGSRGVSGFECSVCGLNHNHSDTKHDIRSAFNVDDELTDAAEFCPFCHCGVNELAMLMDFFGTLGEAIIFFEDQDAFEEVLELDNSTLQKIMKRRRSGDTIPTVIRDAGLREEIPRDMHRPLALFYERWLNIKSAASKAPIHRDTQSEIENEREEVEAFVADLRGE